MLKTQAPRAIWVAGTVLTLFVFGASQRAPAQESLSASDTAQIARGVQALKSGDLDSAESTFNDALRRGIKHPLVFHNLGVIAQQKHNYQLAVSRFRQALLLQPNY